MSLKTIQFMHIACCPTYEISEGVDLYALGNDGRVYMYVGGPDGAWAALGNTIDESTL